LKPGSSPSHDNTERWLVSYADFITLLFAFFVVMFASSQVNKKKVARISDYFEAYISQARTLNPHSAPAPPTLQELESELAQLPPPTLEALAQQELAPIHNIFEQELVAEIQQGKIALSLQSRGLVLSLRESALFPAGSDRFNPEAITLLSRIAATLKRLSDQPVRLEGHSDDAPIQTAQFPSNWELSAARALAVLELLTGRFDLEPNRLAVAGYADFHPVAGNDTTEGRARNRRVDIVVLSRSAALMEPQPQAGPGVAGQPVKLPTPSDRALAPPPPNP